MLSLSKNQCPWEGFHVPKSFVPKSTYAFIPTQIWATINLTGLLISVLSPSHLVMEKSQIYSHHSDEQQICISFISQKLVSFLWIARKTKLDLQQSGLELHLILWFLIVYGLAPPILLFNQFGMGGSGKPGKCYYLLRSPSGPGPASRLSA